MQECLGNSIVELELLVTKTKKYTFVENVWSDIKIGIVAESNLYIFDTLSQNVFALILRQTHIH
jgi:hypothetical protein